MIRLADSTQAPREQDILSRGAVFHRWLPIVVETTFSTGPFDPVGTSSANVVAVWRVPMDLNRPLSDDEWTILSADERARGERFKFDAPRLRLVRCRRALRVILGEWLQVPPSSLNFEYGPHGSLTCSRRIAPPRLMSRILMTGP